MSDIARERSAVPGITVPAEEFHNLFSEAYNVCAEAIAYTKFIKKVLLKPGSDPFSEYLDDKEQVLEEILCDSPLAKSLSNGNTSMVAPIHVHSLIDEARDALRLGDIQEAAHQLRREVDFCNAVSKMDGSPYEKSGLAGLRALKKHKSAKEIDDELQAAWDKAWTENPAPFYKTGF